LKHLIATSTTARIIHTSLFGFFYYLMIGLLLEVLPSFVYLHLRLSTFWAGVAISVQYLATLVTRPAAGRMTDLSEPRAAVLGAPLGIGLETRHGLWSIGGAASGISLLSLALALPFAGVPTVRGARLAFSKVFGRVFLHGLELALGTVGFAAIASFTGLYYASRNWTDPGGTPHFSIWRWALPARLQDFIVGKFGYSAIFLYGSGAAGCAFVLTLLLYHLLREPQSRLSRKILEPLETGETS
jgi:hypothetical protein